MDVFPLFIVSHNWRPYDRLAVVNEVVHIFIQ
jgi:hypothetical protein